MSSFIGEFVALAGTLGARVYPKPAVVKELRGGVTWTGQNYRPP